MESFISLVPRFAGAMLITLTLSLCAGLLGAVLGFLLNALRMHYPVPMALPYGAYVWLIRGIPFMAQLVIVYFGLPVIGITFTAEQATIVSLSIYSSAYFAEIFRTAWASIARGQIEAARAFGIGRWAVFRSIELPQAIVFSIPLLANQMILVIKESAIASVITVPELTFTASDVVASTYAYIGPYAMLIVCYWMLTQCIALLAARATASCAAVRNK
jgi:polar amino acid transport system permease protein